VNALLDGRELCVIRLAHRVHMVQAVTVSVAVRMVVPVIMYLVSAIVLQGSLENSARMDALQDFMVTAVTKDALKPVLVVIVIGCLDIVNVRPACLDQLVICHVLVIPGDRTASVHASAINYTQRAVKQQMVHVHAKKDTMERHVSTSVPQGFMVLDVRRSAPVVLVLCVTSPMGSVYMTALLVGKERTARTPVLRAVMDVIV